MTQLLVIGRWHAVTRDQEAALLAQITAAAPSKLLFVITAADQAGTKRHPLPAEYRAEIVQEMARTLGCPFEVHSITDIPDTAGWVRHVEAELRRSSRGRARLRPANTAVLSGNPEVLGWFGMAGYRTLPAEFHGAMPLDVVGAIVARGDWRQLANDATARVYDRHGLVQRIRDIFADVLLTEDGELSTGRDFKVYAAGMDASLALKISDLCPHIRPGTIVDKGCGTGTLLVHLSTLFPDSQIIGMDLSRELLRTAESQYYPNHNVSIVKGNIIHERFAPGTLSTVLFSSVIHEVYSYNGYDRDQVRLALANTRRELRPGGRVLIRDGVKPEGGHVWMCCDEETERRFRKLAVEFKAKSANPGVSFKERELGGRRWFVLGLHEANEFLSKKDYLVNWAIEVNEEFGVFTLAEWRQELEALGYRIVEARSYCNPWILENRYRGRVWLHADERTKPGKVIPFPDTTAVLVGEALSSPRTEGVGS
jgi:SAM-dependent methyltransferase